MLAGILRTLNGTVRFSAEGGSVERFFSLAGRAGISLWNIRSKEGVTYIDTRARSYKKLRIPARRAGVRMRVVRKRGLPFRLFRYRRRHGVLVGLVLFFGLLCFFSCFVWNVQVSGNSRVSAEEITGVLSSLGVKPGVVRMSVNLQRVENEALIRLPDLSWMAINLRGGTAFVEVRERTYPPELVPLSRPCNVKASRTGQIVRLETYEGMPLVRVNDTVKQGDIIVSGIVEEKNGVQRLAHARAKVIARTKHELVETIPLRQQKQVFTGQQTVRRSLLVAGGSLPLSFGEAPKGKTVQTVYVRALTVFGVQMPVSMRTETYRPYTVQTVTVSKDQAFAEAQQKLAEVEKLEFADLTVLGRSYTRSSNAESVTIRGVYGCEENIAYEEEIHIG